MALLKNTDFQTIGNLKYKFIHITEYVMRSPLEIDEDPKVEVLIKTVDYAITEDNKRLFLPSSQKSYTLNKKITELVENIDLATSLYYQEQVFISFLNTSNNNSNISYFEHIQ